MKNELQNSIDFINKKTNDKSGFSVPSNYFETIEDSFTLKLKEENIVKENGFKTPDSYFDELENKILEQVTSTKKETKVISLKQRMLKLIPMAAAASVILFIGLNSFIFDKTDTLNFENLAENELENWIIDNINLINDNDFEIAYNDIDFDESEFVPNSISSDELENYLSNQDNISIILEND